MRQGCQPCAEPSTCRTIGYCSAFLDALDNERTTFPTPYVIHIMYKNMFLKYLFQNYATSNDDIRIHDKYCFKLFYRDNSTYQMSLVFLKLLQYIYIYNKLRLI